MTGNFLIENIQEKSAIVSGFLKGLASPHRLQILCLLTEGERNVGDMIAATGIAQTSMSQHLAKLKDAGIIDFRRDHRTLYYFICHDAVADIMPVLYKHFCEP